jgi:hypothetical protein
MLLRLYINQTRNIFIKLSLTFRLLLFSTLATFGHLARLTSHVIWLLTPTISSFSRITHLLSFNIYEIASWHSVESSRTSLIIIHSSMIVWGLLISRRASYIFDRAIKITSILTHVVVINLALAV